MAEDKVDRAGKDSFPASDAPANSGIVGPRVQKPVPEERDEAASHKGPSTDGGHAGGTTDQPKPAERSRRK
jgi:hypothetical protein